MKVPRTVWRSGVALAVAAALAAAGCFRRVDPVFYDAFSFARLATAGGAARPSPVIVGIDGASLREYGRWPWPRATLARLIDGLNAGAPAAIGVDLLLAEPSAGDGELAEAIRGGRVILAERLDLHRSGARIRAGRPEYPEGSLAAASLGRGFIDFFPDPDGVARWMLVSASINGREHHSLAAALARAAGESLPAGGRPEAPLNIRLMPGDWPAVSAGDVLAGRSDPGLWRGRPVLIGLTARGVAADEYPVSVQALGRVPGIYLHAYAYSTLTAWGATRDLPRPIALLLGILPVAALIPMAGAGRPWRTFLGYAVLLSLVVPGSLGLFLARWWWGPSLPLAALTVAAAMHLVDDAAAGHRREKKLRAAFAKYVSPQVLRQILAGPAPRLGGEEREITVFFADLRGFSTVAEGRSPELVAADLNRHLHLMSQAILDAGGMVDKFMGDAVMGVFGAPMDQADHRQRALGAARVIQAGLGQSGLLPAGIGMATGRAVVGNIGGSERLEYTAIGDPVNLASRLEEMAGPHEILATADCFTDTGPDPRWKNLGAMAIRGRVSPVVVHRLVTRITDEYGT